MESINKIQEFVAFDAEGNAKVLRRTTLHPGLSSEEIQDLRFPPSPGDDEGLSLSSAGGSIRLFADFKHLKTALQGK